uniref:Uncharacterized protein n=1 Tax=Arundo donax TaxID=35708 RepID=A0A0A9H221_ARUDO
MPPPPSPARSMPFQLQPPATNLAPPRPPQPQTAPFSSEFLSMIQEMIRIEVRNYMSGSGFDPRADSAVHAATKRMMGMAKIE